MSSKTIPPLERILKPLSVKEKRLLGPGPSNMADSISKALAQPLLGHLHPEFLEIMDDVKAGLQYVFQTKNPLTFAISGTGHAGMECAILNLLEPDETILVLQNGIWGQRAADLSKRMNLNVKTITVPEGGIIELEDFKKAVETFKPAVAFLCQGESSTGVLQPIEGFGEVCRRNGTLLLVDTVASLGATPFNADELLVDCVYTATQKVLNCPPGLAPISFNERAFYHHTAPISIVYALREALSIVAKEGLENVIERHQVNAQVLYESLENIGMKLFVENPKHRLPCLTTVKVPNGVDWKDCQSKLNEKGIEIAGGLGPTTGKIFRIGTFGLNSSPVIIAQLTAALNTYLGKAEQLEDRKASL